jgi:hypothetical protein
VGIATRIPRLLPRGDRVEPGFLDLRHGGAATDAAAQVGAALAGHEGEDHRGRPGGPAEPEEGGGCLGFAAALGGVGRAVGDVVGSCVVLFLLALIEQHTSHAMTSTYRIVAAVHTQIRGSRNGSAEPEQHVEDVKRDVDDGHAEAVEEGRRDEVQQRQHAEDGDEDVVVDHC